MKHRIFRHFFEINGPKDRADFVVFKNHLTARGYTAIEDQNRIQNCLSELEETALIKVPFFLPDGRILPHRYVYFVRTEEKPGSEESIRLEEEKIPGVLPGRFRIELEDSKDEYKIIKRRLPSELLFELSYDRLNISPEKVKSWSFEPNQYPSQEKKYRIYLIADDLLILSRMEKEKIDIDILLKSSSPKEDRRLGRRLEDYLRLSPLVVKAAKGRKYTISREGLDGRYAVEVHHSCLPEWLRG